MKHQKGNIVILLCFVILLVLGSGAYFWWNSSSQESEKLDPKVVFENLKKQVSEAMQSPRAVDASLERNPNPFSCLYTVQANCQNKGSQIQFYEDISAQPLSQLIRDTGLNTGGVVGCRGFPGAQCPFRVEASWEPVCNQGYCEGTKSFKIKMKVIYNNGVSAEAMEWENEQMYSPTIKLSEATVCERGGGVWSTTECLTPAQASERNIASSGKGNGVVAPEGMSESQILREEGVLSEAQADPICPNQIQLQNQIWNLEQITPVRAQVRMPAVNGCPADDVFTFQCTPKVPAAFENEGQWIQVEAQMAPFCDGAGNPIDPILRQ